MTLRPTLIVLAALASLAGCERASVNAPTDPAEPVRTPEATAEVVEAPGAGLAPPGVGPTSFVGRPTMQDGPAADHTPPPGSNITSIERARAARRGTRSGTQPQPAPRQPGAPSGRSRTGS